MKGRTYVLNTKNIREKDFELVGSEAIDNSLLLNEGVLIPPSFVITSICFDDFLTAANLVAPISKALGNVKPFIRESARAASEEITNLIMNAKFPGIISDPITHAYQNLAEFNNQPIVTMMPSNIIDPTYLPQTELFLENIVIKNINDLLYNIKLVWLTLFTTEAIEVRANTYYKGPLSLALIIQNKIKPEVSGKAFSIAGSGEFKDKMKITSLYGITHSTIELDNFDTYLVDKKEMKVVERNIMPQDFMYITKIKFEKDEDPFTKVNISPAWKNVQKIDDSKIIKIGEIIARIEKKFGVPIELDWGIEAGEIYTLEIKPQNIQEIKPNKKEDKVHTELEKKKESDKPNIKELTKEIEQMVQSDQSITIDEDESPKESEVVLPEIANDAPIDHTKIAHQEEVRTKTPIFLDISTMNSRVLTALKNFSGSFYDGTEMVLNNNILPEEYRGNHSKLSELIEKYALDISIAAKNAGSKPLIYQFSTISEHELKLLGIESGKYKYNHDERFIDYPESLIVEAIAVKKALLNYGAKNISISFPGIRNLQNLDDLKKVIGVQGIKKNSLLKFYCEVAIPSFIFDFEKIGRNELNGIIINYTKLLKLITFRSELREIDHQLGFRALELFKTLATDKDMEIYVRLDVYNHEILEQVIKLQTNGIIFSSIPNKETLESIVEIEKEVFKEKVISGRKRGRKVKELF